MISPDLQAPDECPTIQFSPDTGHPGLVSLRGRKSKGWFHKAALASEAGHHYRVTGLLTQLTDLATNWRFVPPLRLNNLLEKLTELRKIFMFTSLLERLQLRNSQMKETHRARPGEGCGAPIPSPGLPSSRHLTCLPMKLSKTCQLGFSLRFPNWA